MKVVAIHQRILNSLTFIVTDRNKDLTQRIKECFQNLICNWNVAVDINFGVYSKKVVNRYPVLHQYLEHRHHVAQETSEIMTMKTLGESLHGTSHVSKVRRL